MVEHGQLLRADVFSSTVNGAPYSVGEWLGELAIYGSYLLGGWAGIALLRASLIAVGSFFITRVALRAAPAPFALAVTALALALSEISWTDRPQLFTFALFPLLLDLLLAARAGRTRLLFVVPPLILLWTNLHGGYALGLALVAIFSAEAVLTRRNALPFAAAAVLALGAIEEERRLFYVALTRAENRLTLTTLTEKKGKIPVFVEDMLMAETHIVFLCPRFRAGLCDR